MNTTPTRLHESTNADICGQDGSGGAHASCHQAVPGGLLLREEEVVGGPERGVRADQRAPNHDGANDVPANAGEEHGDDGDPAERGEHGAVVELHPEDPERLAPLRGAREVEEEPGGAEEEEHEERAGVPEQRGRHDGEHGQRVVGAEVGGVAAHPGERLPERGRLGEGRRAEDLGPGPARRDERLALLPEARDDLAGLDQRRWRRRGVLDRPGVGGGDLRRGRFGVRVRRRGRRVGWDLGVPSAAATGGGGRRVGVSADGGGRGGRDVGGAWAVHGGGGGRSDVGGGGGVRGGRGGGRRGLGGGVVAHDRGEIGFAGDRRGWGKVGREEE